MTAAQGSSLVDSATLRDSDDMDYEPTTENDESEDEDEEVEGEEHDDDDEYVDENVNGMAQEPLRRSKCRSLTAQAHTVTWSESQRPRPKICIVGSQEPSRACVLGLTDRLTRRRRQRRNPRGLW